MKQKNEQSLLLWSQLVLGENLSYSACRISCRVLLGLYPDPSSCRMVVVNVVGINQSSNFPYWEAVQLLGLFCLIVAI
jgi:hypothetical protein